MGLLVSYNWAVGFDNYIVFVAVVNDRSLLVPWV